MGDQNGGRLMGTHTTRTTQQKQSKKNFRIMSELKNCSHLITAAISLLLRPVALFKWKLSFQLIQLIVVLVEGGEEEMCWDTG